MALGTLKSDSRQNVDLKIVALGHESRVFRLESLGKTGDPILNSLVPSTVVAMQLYLPCRVENVEVSYMRDGPVGFVVELRCDTPIVEWTS